MPIAESRLFTEAPVAANGAAACVAGALPDGLSGTLLRNGGGRFRVGPDALCAFDAHGAVVGLTLADGAAAWRAAIVETPVWKQELAAGKITTRRIFTNKPGGWTANALRLDLGAGNGANHDVYAWNGVVYATDSPGHYALDTQLKTTSEQRWGSPRGHNLAPMPRIDPTHKRLVSYLVDPGTLRPDKLAFIEFDEAGQEIVRTPYFPLAAGPSVIHGHAFSDAWYVVAEMPAKLNPAGAVFGTNTIWRSLQWPKDASASFVIVPRGRPGNPVRVPLPGATVVFHALNAFDEGDKLVVYATAYRGVPGLWLVHPDIMANLPEGPHGSPPAQLMRYVIDVAKGELVEAKVLNDTPTEACDVDPRFRGKAHRYLWGPVPGTGGASLPDLFGTFHAVARFDAETGALDTWDAGPERFCSPPAFVARPGSDIEGDGWILVWLSTPDTTLVAVLDAMNVAAGPLALLDIGLPLPMVTHTRFAPDVRLA